jgi:hypothetical protein
VVSFGRGWEQITSTGLWTRACGILIGLCICCGPAVAQSGPTPPARAVFYSRLGPLTETIAREQSDPRPKTADGALQALDWLIYGNVLVGGAYDSNVLSAPNQQSAYGMRFQPYVVAERNTGIQRTLIYGIGDFRFYPSIGRTDVADTHVGLAHVWEIERDLLFRTQAEAERGLESSSLNSSLNTAGVVTEPVKFTSLFASTSIEKGFGRFFTAIGGSVNDTTYDNTKDNFGNPVNEQYRNGTRVTLNGRVGYHITPITYAFVEPSLNWGRFNSSSLNSSGYQVVGGLGTERISLFNGEIYGGSLVEEFSNPTIPTLTTPIYGGRISWFPTRFVTVTVSADQVLGTSDFSSNAFTNGSVTKLDTEKLSVFWSTTREVDLEGRIVFRQYDYLASFRRDNSTEFGAAVTYKFTPRFGLVLDYSHVDLTSNLAGAGWTRDFVSVSGKTKF